MKTKFPKSVHNVLVAQFFDDEYKIISENWNRYSNKSFDDLSIDDLIVEAENVLYSYFEDQKIGVM